MDYTFVSQFSRDGPKRRRLAKACETCRARKKRCVHFESDHDNQPGQLESPSKSDRPSNGYTSPIIAGEEQNPNGLTKSAGPTPKGRAPGGKNVRRSSLSALMNSTAHRFISDLHPEASFLRRNPTDVAHPLSKSMDNVGVWVDRREWEDLIKQRDSANAGTTSDIQSPNSAHAPNASPKLESSQTAALLDIFFTTIHLMVPVIDEEEFRQLYANGSIPEALLFTICLVAAKDKAAEPYLYMGETASLMSARDFCTRLHDAARAAMSSNRYDKITLIRMHALLSLHDEGSEGAEDASLSISHALHHCQTLGLHLGQQASLPNKNSRLMKRLFWCVWTLDRFNAAIHGRPIVMADRDIAIEPFGIGESGYPALDIMLRIGRIINEAISFYRPGNLPTVTGWEGIFPSFEEIVDEARGWELGPTMLSTLHIAYLSTAILSHRSQGLETLPNKTPSQVRQNIAVLQIIRIMRPGRLEKLHALTVLPYAISLAVAVTYKQFRQGRLRHLQEDARADFQTCCTVLQELKRTWSCADVMATLAQKVSNELKRAPEPSSRVQKPNRDERVLEGFPSACRDEGLPVVDGQSNAGAADGVTDGQQGDMMLDSVAQDSSANGDMIEAQYIGQGLFEGIDDIFGTYLDPNYPMNLEDLSFLDDLGAIDWAAQGPSG